MSNLIIAVGAVITLIFTGFILGIIVAGAIYYRSYKKNTAKITMSVMDENPYHN